MVSSTELVLGLDAFYCAIAPALDSPSLGSLRLTCKTARDGLYFAGKELCKHYGVPHFTERDILVFHSGG